MERYNIRLSFKGEDSLKFVLGVVGEVIIYAGRDLYIEGASASLIESLRGLKRLGLDMVIGGKAAGCFKTYDLNKFVPKSLRPEIQQMGFSVVDKVNRADINTILTTTSAEIDIEDPEEEEVPDEESQLNESEVVEETEDLGDYIITTESSSANGKSLKELSNRQLKGLLRFLNDEDKEAVQKYLSIE